MKGHILKQYELKEQNILTDDHVFNLQPGEYKARLNTMAECRNGLRLFFDFDDGRKIIAVVYWWQKYLGFTEAKPGTRYILTYTKKIRRDKEGNDVAEVYLTAASPEKPP